MAYSQLELFRWINRSNFRDKKLRNEWPWDCTFYKYLLLGKWSSNMVIWILYNVNFGFNKRPDVSLILATEAYSCHIKEKNICRYNDIYVVITTYYVVIMTYDGGHYNRYN